MADPADPPWPTGNFVLGQSGWLVEAYARRWRPTVEFDTAELVFVRDFFTPNWISAISAATSWRSQGYLVKVLRDPPLPTCE